MHRYKDLPFIERNFARVLKDRSANCDAWAHGTNDQGRYTARYRKMWWWYFKRNPRQEHTVPSSKWMRGESIEKEEIMKNQERLTDDRQLMNRCYSAQYDSVVSWINKLQDNNNKKRNKSKK